MFRVLGAIMAEEGISAHVPDAGSIVSAHVSLAERDVLAERRRQVWEEGWTQHHDDQHTNGQMAMAAACYAYRAAGDAYSRHQSAPDGVQLRWPWSVLWWKPKGRRRDLVRAAALIIAEIERMDRLDG